MLPIRPGILSPGCAGLLNFAHDLSCYEALVLRKSENDPPIVTPPTLRT